MGDDISEHVASLIPKPSGIKPPSSIPSLQKVSRICSSHDKKPELPVAATPKKSEYKFIIFKVVQWTILRDYRTCHLEFKIIKHKTHKLIFLILLHAFFGPFEHEFYFILNIHENIFKVNIKRQF